MFHPLRMYCSVLSSYVSITSRGLHFGTVKDIFAVMEIVRDTERMWSCNTISCEKSPTTLGGIAGVTLENEDSGKNPH